jgi:hypothetical protein
LGTDLLVELHLLPEHSMAVPEQVGHVGAGLLDGLQAAEGLGVGVLEGLRTKSMVGGVKSCFAQFSIVQVHGNPAKQRQRLDLRIRSGQQWNINVFKTGRHVEDRTIIRTRI